eukprot:10672042-Heterocapsa_arctica.AAC.1
MRWLDAVAACTPGLSMDSGTKSSSRCGDRATAWHVTPSSALNFAAASIKNSRMPHVKSVVTP